MKRTRKPLALKLARAFFEDNPGTDPGSISLTMGDGSLPGDAVDTFYDFASALECIFRTSGACFLAAAGAPPQPIPTITSKALKSALRKWDGMTNRTGGVVDHRESYFFERAGERFRWTRVLPVKVAARCAEFLNSSRFRDSLSFQYRAHVHVYVARRHPHAKEARNGLTIDDTQAWLVHVAAPWEHWDELSGLIKRTIEQLSSVAA